MFGSAPGVVTPAPPNARSGDGCALARDTVSQTPPPACRVQDAELFRGGAASAGGAALSAARRTVSTNASPRTVPQPFAEPGRAGCAAVGRTGHSPNSPARPAPAPWQAPTAWFLSLSKGVIVRLAAGYFCVRRTFSHKATKAQKRPGLRRSRFQIAVVLSAAGQESQKPAAADVFFVPLWLCARPNFFRLRKFLRGTFSPARRFWRAPPSLRPIARCPIVAQSHRCGR